jgi:hypothetical protein
MMLLLDIKLKLSIMKSLKNLIVILLCLPLLTVNAKTKNNQFKRSDAGIRVGAAFGIPAGAIPDGASGLPMPAVSLGMFYSLKFTPKWSIQIGAETYSMKAKFNTPYSQFEYIGNVEKYINGNVNSTRVDTIFLDKATVENGMFNNKYIAVPITANYHFRKGWSFSFGGYVAYNFKKQMEGTATEIAFGNRDDKSISVPVTGTMPFNESHQIKDWDFGLNVGGNYEMRSGINFDMRLNAGMANIFVKEFTAPPSAYHNIVIQTTVGYRIGGSRRI